ncbi:MAG: hypothetical protein WBQ32_03095, partial [Ignavibacteriaceae bacterium]
MFRVFSVLLSFIAILVGCSEKTQFSGKFTFTPDKVKPGDEITIFYNPDSSDLGGSEGIKCIAYLYNNDLINAVDVTLKPEDNIL